MIRAAAGATVFPFSHEASARAADTQNRATRPVGITLRANSDNAGVV
jgi:hypothetical protein